MIRSVFVFEHVYRLCYIVIQRYIVLEIVFVYNCCCDYHLSTLLTIIYKWKLFLNSIL